MDLIIINGVNVDSDSVTFLFMSMKRNKATSSQPTKKSRTNTHGVLSAFTANANGGQGHTRLKTARKGISGLLVFLHCSISFQGEDRSKTNVSDYMTTLVHSAPHPENNRSETSQNVQSQCTLLQPISFIYTLL